METLKFGIIGDPIAHSLSPALFKAAYGGRYAYDLIEGADFEASWRRFLGDGAGYSSEDQPLGDGRAIVDGAVTPGYHGINVTAPFKVMACERADILSPECQRIGAANLIVKTSDGTKAYNSDYLGVRALLDPMPRGTAAVIGFGGAGKAALAAAEDLGFTTSLFRHNELRGGVRADVILFTLPRPAEGIEKFDCACLIEANYKDPSFTGARLKVLEDSGAYYVSGLQWLLQQAITGYSLFTGEQPDIPSMIQQINTL